jgi:hypothetical protein
LNIDEDIFERAIGYPYAIPERSYIYHNGICEELQTFPEGHDFSTLTPVLAVGSNQSPQQLGRKFPGSGWAPIPVVRVALQDFDTVYSAHITGYGSIAATLCHVPGTTVNLFVNWLDADHLRRMHDTELGNENYEFGTLTDIELCAEIGPSLNEISLYHGLRGIYARDGRPVPLAEVKASNRQYTALTQRQILEHIRNYLEPDAPLDDFVFKGATDKSIRQLRTERIAKGRLPFSHEGYTPAPL